MEANSSLEIQNSSEVIFFRNLINQILLNHIERQFIAHSRIKKFEFIHQGRLVKITNNELFLNPGSGDFSIFSKIPDLQTLLNTLDGFWGVIVNSKSVTKPTNSASHFKTASLFERQMQSNLLDVLINCD